MPVTVEQPKELLIVNGVEFAAVNAGIYQDKHRHDLALIKLADNTQVATVFTKNAFCAAPVLIAKSHLGVTDPKYLLINAGNANAGTGQQGLKDALACCNALSRLVDVKVSQVMPFSTGVIGERLPVEKIQQKLPQLVRELQPDAILKAAEAIKTTDTVAKAISKTVRIGDKTVVITGIAKGSGMIKPDMATMLSYIFTDADIKKELLESLLHDCVEKSFNRITVDGDTSTNDACLLAATAKSNVVIDDKSSEKFSKFNRTLHEVFTFLAQAIIRDAEGATKFITVIVDKGKSTDECLTLAYNIAHSPLVKTALFASDPNWGRILAVVGRSKIEELDISKVDIYLADTCIIQAGELSKDYTEKDGQRETQKEEITIRINLNRGNVMERIWTSDLSYDYVKINSDYRS